MPSISPRGQKVLELRADELGADPVGAPREFQRLADSKRRELLQALASGMLLCRPHLLFLLQIFLFLLLFSAVLPLTRLSLSS